MYDQWIEWAVDVNFRFCRTTFFLTYNAYVRTIYILIQGDKHRIDQEIGQPVLTIDMYNEFGTKFYCYAV